MMIKTLILLISIVTLNMYGRTIYYTVKAGDSLWSIARRFDTDIDTIRQINKIKGNKIYKGMKIKISKHNKASKKVKDRKFVMYRVKKGDTLIGIARRYSINIRDICRINNITHNNIFAGQLLKLPLKGTKKLNKCSRYRGGFKINVKKGTILRAFDSGYIKYYGWLRGYGNVIIIKHSNNLYSIYGGNIKLLKNGFIKKGASFGKALSSGFIYFEINKNGKPISHKYAGIIKKAVISFPYSS